MRKRALFASLALCLFAMCGQGWAQDSTRRLGEFSGPGDQMKAAADEGPHVFLGGPLGSYWLNGKDGSDHYTYLNTVWKFDLVFEKSDANFYYYYEKGFKDYHWAFDRHITQQHTVAIWRMFPEDKKQWTLFEYGYITILPKNALGTDAMRKKAE